MAGPVYYEGQKFHDPNNPNRPVLVWTKGGFVTEDKYKDMQGTGQEAFDKARDLARRIDKGIATVEKQPNVAGFWGKLFAGDQANPWKPGLAGTKSYTLDRQMQPIRSNEFAGALQTMRNNSPTGGAVGNVSDREGVKFETMNANLDIGMEPNAWLDEARHLKQVYARELPGLTMDNPRQLGGASRTGIPRGMYYRDAQGNIRRNDNFDAGNPIFRSATPRPASPPPAAPSAGSSRRKFNPATGRIE
jgi:hypothetical protein